MKRTREYTFGEYCRAARENEHGKTIFGSRESESRESESRESESRERVDQEKVRNVAPSAPSKDKQFFAIEVTKDAK